MESRFVLSSSSSSPSAVSSQHELNEIKLQETSNELQQLSKPGQSIDAALALRLNIHLQDLKREREQLSELAGTLLKECNEIDELKKKKEAYDRYQTAVILARKICHNANNFFKVFAQHFDITVRTEFALENYKLFIHTIDRYKKYSLNLDDPIHPYHAMQKSIAKFCNMALNQNRYPCSDDLRQQIMRFRDDFSNQMKEILSSSDPLMPMVKQKASGSSASQTLQELDEVPAFNLQQPLSKVASAVPAQEISQRSKQVKRGRVESKSAEVPPHGAEAKSVSLGEGNLILNPAMGSGTLNVNSTAGFFGAKRFKEGAVPLQKSPSSAGNNLLHSQFLTTPTPTPSPEHMTGTVTPASEYNLPPPFSLSPQHTPPLAHASGSDNNEKEVDKDMLAETTIGGSRL